MLLKYFKGKFLSKYLIIIVIQKVGFIGMGNMGLSMASNLVANGFEVKGYDLSEKTLEKASAKVSIFY